MEAKHWVKSSQNFYRRLLKLYPAEHRATYEGEMFQLFTDQCRAAYDQRGAAGRLMWWIRILIDVSKSVIREHFSDSQARLGLLDTIPNAPLPWKGVALVLVPGLIFLVSQIMQLLGEDWFFVVFYRAAYVLILPVLLVWVLTRRFPVWGLIPLGLLFETLWTYVDRVGLVYLSSKLPFAGSALRQLEKVSPTMLFTWACLCLLCGLLWLNVRRRTFSKVAWLWLGLYGLLIVVQIGSEIYRYLSFWGWDFSALLKAEDERAYVFTQLPQDTLYSAIPFLLLIFAGTLFVGRHGRLSFLLPLGFLLPTVIFGRYSEEWNNFVPFFLISMAVMVYRLAIAIAAPLGLTRSASALAGNRATVIPIAIALLTQILLDVAMVIGYADQAGYTLSWANFVPLIVSQLVVAAGLGLAVTLYQNRLQSPNEATSLPPVLAS